MKLILFISLLIAISSDEFPDMDLSGGEGDIDWSTADEDKYFVIIPAGYGTGPDDYFEINYAMAKSVGINVGAYWYAYAQSTDDAVNEAYSFINTLSGKQFEWPVCWNC